MLAFGRKRRARGGGGGSGCLNNHRIDDHKVCMPRTVRFLMGLKKGLLMYTTWTRGNFAKVTSAADCIPV